MCLTVQNLFNEKEIILGREEILEVVKYALENNVVDVSLFCEEDGELRYIEDFDYDIALTRGGEND